MLFFKKKYDFCPLTYRQFNQDLIQLSDKDLLDHFLSHQHEPRIYKKVASDVEFLSMKWLRGNGLEIGAGANPTPLFGNASVTYADCDESLAFGGKDCDFLRPVDSKDFDLEHKNRYDFVIVSHVLEHCDSFIRAIQNLTSVTKKGGMIYIVLPDINFLNDKNFIKNFDFTHHIDEYSNPMKYADLHDDLHIDACCLDSLDYNIHAEMSEDYQNAIKNRKIPQNMRFMHHKHNYDLSGWIELLDKTNDYLGCNLSLVDVRYGHLRNDCHFIMQRII